MAKEASQNLANHARIDPPFHYFILPVFGITMIGEIIIAIRYPSLHRAWMVLLSAAAVALAFKTRLYALKVQTRLIRLEERLRLSTLLAEPLRGRIGELTESQLVALRFASDAEVSGLTGQALEKNLTNKQIKALVQNWRADEWRV